MWESASFSGLDDIFEGVNVGLAQSPSVDFQPSFLFQLLYCSIDGRCRGADVFGHSFLTGEYPVVVPGVAQKLAVNRLRGEAQLLIIQKAVGYLRETFRRYGVKPFQDDVLYALQC